MAAGRTIRGLYTGGTLAAEAGLLLAEMLDLEPATEHADGFMLDQGGHRIIDLGDDSYTRGRPHPMIDPAQRNAMIRELADDTGCGVLLLDIVLGFGSNRDPAGEAARAVMDLRAARGGGDPVTVIATLTGTEEDPQARSAQAAALDEAGIVLAGSTREAVALAMRLVTGAAPPSGSLPRLLADAPSVINIGLRAFAEDLQASGVPVVHLQWEPPAGGDTHLQDLLNSLK
jgi:FdrA protein